MAIHPMFFLATASPSEEIGDWYFRAALALFLLSAAAAVVAVVVGCRAGKGGLRWVRRLVWAVILASVYPIAFMAYVHQIDFAAGDEGAPGPLWETLRWPVAPVLLTVFCLVITWLRDRLRRPCLRRMPPA